MIAAPGRFSQRAANVVLFSLCPVFRQIFIYIVARFSCAGGVSKCAERFPDLPRHHSGVSSSQNAGRMLSPRLSLSQLRLTTSVLESGKSLPPPALSRLDLHVVLFNQKHWLETYRTDTVQRLRRLPIHKQNCRSNGSINILDRWDFAKLLCISHSCTVASKRVLWEKFEGQ